MNARLLSTGLIILACSVSSASAKVLMLDFGATTVIDDTGTPNTLVNSLTNSPYHAATPAFADTGWNKVQLADIAANGLVWSDSTTASGVALNLGGVSGTSTTLTLGTAPTSTLTGGAVSSSTLSVYQKTSVGKDGIFMAGTGTPSASSVGFQLSGLDAGGYHVYLLMRQTNATTAHTMTGYVGVSSTTGNFDFSGYTNKSLTFASTTSSVTAWAEDANYVKFSVNLNANDVLNLAVAGNLDERRGFINAVQIVPIPEPAMGAGIVAFLGAVLVRRRSSR